MKNFSIFLIFLSLFPIIFSQDFAEVNAKFQSLNDEVRSSFQVFLEEAQNYVEKLNSALASLPSFAQFLDPLPTIIEDFKDIDFPYFEDIKTCDDLKLRNSSTFLLNTKFFFTDWDFSVIWERLVKVNENIVGEYWANKSFVDESVKNFRDIIERKKVSENF